MAPWRLSVRNICLLLLAWIGLTAFVQIDIGEDELRWSGYSVLTPVVGGALLPWRQTVLVALVNLVMASFIYGFVIRSVSTGGRLVVLFAVLLASVLALAACRLRLDREGRVTGLTRARDRLALLKEAGTRVGTTLDVQRTARELADLAVPRFADVLTVDLLDSVLRGGETPGGPPGEAVALRRIVRRSARDAAACADPDPGAPGACLTVRVPAGELAAGGPARAGRLLDAAAVETWLNRDPDRTPGTGRCGGDSGMAIVLRARGAMLGVAVFVRHRRREGFDAEDLLLAEEIAAHVAVCLDNAHRYTRERRRSLALQRSLMPLGLPDTAAVEAASRYLPTGSEAGVGGDWFDVIRLSGARVALVVGDVAGHGPRASAAMGRLCAAVRTLAEIDLSPDELLTRLDDVVTRLDGETDPARGTYDAELDSLSGGEIGATCLYAVYDPVSRECAIAGAGHPPPVLVGPDGGRAELLDLPTGPPLGLAGLPFECGVFDVPEGSLLAFYTNGLVTSRSRDLDRGLEELCRVLEEAGGAGASLEGTCDTVLGTLLDDHPSDDIAFLLARTRALDADHVVTWDLPDDRTAAGVARELAVDRLTAWGAGEAAFVAELVVSELVTNAILYGEAPVRLRLIRERALICEVSDASSTAPHLRRARSLDENGRGLFIVAQSTDRWGTRHGPHGKTIWSELPLEQSADGQARQTLPTPSAGGPLGTSAGGTH